MGFTLPASVTGAAVRSYRTFSPLPGRNMTPDQAVLFSVALSVKLALSEPPRPLAGMLPYGDRTFLPPASKARPRATTRTTGPALFSQKAPAPAEKSWSGRYHEIADGVHRAMSQEPGDRPDDVVVNLVEVAKENWSFGNGVAQYAT